MGADIHSYVERRILVPRFSDRVMRVSERTMQTGGIEELEKHEARHTVTWKHVKLLTWIERTEENPLDTAIPWGENYTKHYPDIYPWYENRNYRLFGVLGGVRERGGDILDKCHHRGLPEGFSGPDWVSNEDIHSVTWYMCQELVDARIDIRIGEGYGEWEDVKAFVQMNKDLVKKFGPRDVRITLGWDN